jgi:hypothetical protein
MGETWEQCELQFGPFNPYAGTGIAPQGFEISFRQHDAVLITEVPSANNRPCILNAGGQAERKQNAHAVALDQKSSS